MTATHHTVSDETLVAYLDGALAPAERADIDIRAASNPALAGRIALLAKSSLSYAQAFQQQLAEADADKLQSMLSALPVAPALPIRKNFARRKLIGAVAAALLVGIAGDRLVLIAQNQLGHDDDAESYWRSVVAEYLALYTAETLEAVETNDASRQAQLSFVGQRMGLTLDLATLRLPGLDLKRTQLLQYDDRPLGQILYLDPEYGPLAFCLVKSDAGRQDLKTEQRYGLNIAYWSSASHAFIMAADQPMARLASLARGIIDASTLS